MNPRVEEVRGAGHPILDRDHDVLLSMVAELRTATEASGISHERIMLQLRAYLESHFENEEEVMRSVQYPGIEDHKAEHARLLEETEAALQAVSGADRDSIQRLALAAEIEIVQHMGAADKDLADYLKKMEVAAGTGRPFGVFGRD